MVQFVDVGNVIDLVAEVGVEPLLIELAGYIEDDFRRWPVFEKRPRVSSHSREGVIELMPVSDGERYALKYVNGHPGNASKGLQTVTGFGLLADVRTGYPVFLSEMTILTALRTAATSALAAKHLARRDSTTMAMIGLGAQSEFQALAFRALLGVRTLSVFDIDPAAQAKFVRNLLPLGFSITPGGQRGGRRDRRRHHHDGDGGQAHGDGRVERDGGGRRAHQRRRRRLPGQDRA